MYAYIAWGTLRQSKTERVWFSPIFEGSTASTFLPRRQPARCSTWSFRKQPWWSALIHVSLLDRSRRAVSGGRPVRLGQHRQFDVGGDGRGAHVRLCRVCSAEEPFAPDRGQCLDANVAPVLFTDRVAEPDFVTWAIIVVLDGGVRPRNDRGVGDGDGELAPGLRAVDRVALPAGDDRDGVAAQVCRRRSRRAASSPVSLRATSGARRAATGRATR